VTLLKIIGLKVKVKDNIIFQKTHFSGKAYLLLTVRCRRPSS